MNYARIKWRNAVDLRHLPVGTHSLAPKPGTLVRLAFQKWLDRTKVGPRGRTRTCNLPGLSGTPLLVGLHAGAGARPPVPTVGFAPTLCAF